jgi:uncharacterized protein YhjY with autotransporter beta-barrel domain
VNRQLGYWLVGGFCSLIQVSEDAVADCVKDPITGNFTCSGAGMANVGTPISSTDTATRQSAALVLASELLEEEGEVIRETGESAGPGGGSFGAFATGLTSNTDLDASNDVPGSSGDTWGGVLGGDYSWDRYRVGLAVDYTSEEVDYDDDKGTQDTDELGLQLFGIMRPIPNSYAALVFRYASLDIDSTRLTEASQQPIASGETDGIRYGVTGGGGYSWKIAKRTAFNLSAWFAWQQNEIDGYTETGADGLGDIGDGDQDTNLQFPDDEYSTFDGMLELKMTHAFSTTGADWFPSVSLGYVHEFESDERTITAFVASNPFLGPLVYTTAASDEDYIRLGATITADFRQGTSLYAGYQGVFLDEYRDEYLITLGMRQAF